MRLISSLYSSSIFVALELGEAAELQVEDGLRLAVAHVPRLRHQLRLGVVGGGGAADESR